MDFETHDDVEIRVCTDLWGIFQFNLDSGIPVGTVISAVTVKAYVGRLTAEDDLTAAVDISAVLIDPAYVPIITDDVVINVRFQYPGDDYRGNRATIVFDIELAVSGATHCFYCHSFKIP